MVYLSYRLLFTGQLAKSNIKLFVGVNLIFHQNNIANQLPKIQQFSPDWSLMVTTLSDVWHQFNSHHFLTLLPHQYWPWSHHSANYSRTVKLSPNYMEAFTSDILAHPHQVKYYTSQHYHKIMTAQQHIHQHTYLYRSINFNLQYIDLMGYSGETNLHWTPSAGEITSQHN